MNKLSIIFAVAFIGSVRGQNTFPNNGNAGVGTNNPQHPLDVNGNIKASGKLIAGSTFTIDGANGSMINTAWSGSADRNLVIDAAGAIQPGPPSGACLPGSPTWHVGGDNVFSLSQNSNNDLATGTCDNVDFMLKSNNVKRQWLKTDGTIGFGTSVGSNSGGPEYRFKAGAIRVQGPLNSYGGPQIVFDFNDGSTPFGEWGIEYAAKQFIKPGLNFWKPFGSTNSGNYFMFLADDGMVGIGTPNPTRRLTVDAWNNDGFQVQCDNFKNAIEVYNKMTGRVEFKVKSSGFAWAREINVLPNNTPIPDYVFEKDYGLMNFSELKKYLEDNKHLPNIPGGKEITKNGLNLGEMQLKQLEKIEELFLYALQLKNENEDLKKEIGEIRQRLQKLENK